MVHQVHLKYLQLKQDLEQVIRSANSSGGTNSIIEDVRCNPLVDSNRWSFIKDINLLIMQLAFQTVGILRWVKNLSGNVGSLVYKSS